MISHPASSVSSVRRWTVRLVAVFAAVAFLPATVGATPSTPTQDAESLKAKAARLAAELDNLEGRASSLDEDYNSTYLEVEEMKAALAATESEVSDARDAFAVNESEAKTIAIQAYVGTSTGDSEIDLLGSSDLDEASRRKTYLSAANGDRTDVMAEIDIARQDLESKEARLAAAKDKVDAKLADLNKAKDELTETITQQEALYESVKGDLAKAVEEERAARAAAQAATARRVAEEAAQNRSTQSTATAVTVSPTRTNSSSGSAAATTAPAPVPVAAPAPAPAPNSAGAKAVQVAMAQLGDPYVWAASGPNSFDCSGLVQFAYSAAGISLPHSSRSLRSMTRYISEGQLQPGDLVFGGNPVHHVGIYIGGGQMVHAPSSGDVVKVSGIYRVTSAVSFGRL